VLSCNDLMVDESLLTGESVPVMKESGPLHESHLSLGDQTNMAFMGTHVVGGHGTGICVATGTATELGHIAHLVATERAGEVPLKRRMDQLTQRLVLAAFLLCLLIFGIGLLQKKPALEVLLVAVSLAVAAIPEGLPAVITISLSLGALRLARRGVLVRRLQAVEALGSITTICADKTGTLTLNRMEVRNVYLGGTRYEIPQALADLPLEPADFFQTLALCNDADSEETGQKAFGDPMEIALLHFVSAAGFSINSLRKDWKRQEEIPFDADRKRMTTFHEKEGRKLALMKGAPETVLPLCRQERDVSGSREISESRRRELREIQESMAAEGFRVLAVAMREITVSGDPSGMEEEMTFLGFVGLQDPPRPEAKDAIAACRSAGIRPVMMTGDHPATAAAIGRELGLSQADGGVITGSDLKREGRNILDERALHTSLYARVSPEDKLKIIEVLQDTRQFVAMTGDG
ncbi:MAG TPA: ATPase, partial [Deltaproteobacteria bacterium]|nr:ATPase [Deltaproteobacteria bacterium]